VNRKSIIRNKARTLETLGEVLKRVRELSAENRQLRAQCRDLTWENDILRTVLKALYDKIRIVGGPPIEAEDLEAARLALGGER
jgi:hypothetical protein